MPQTPQRRPWVFSISGNQTLTVRLGSAAVGAAELQDMYRNRKPEPLVWPSRSNHRTYLVIATVFVLLRVVNLWWASTPVRQLAFLGLFMNPIGVVARFVKGFGRS